MLIRKHDSISNLVFSCVFSQSQLEDGLESDSGQLVKDLTLFDTLPVDDDQQF